LGFGFTVNCKLLSGARGSDGRTGTATNRADRILTVKSKATATLFNVQQTLTASRLSTRQPRIRRTTHPASGKEPTSPIVRLLLYPSRKRRSSSRLAPTPYAYSRRILPYCAAVVALPWTDCQPYGCLPLEARSTTVRLHNGGLTVGSFEGTPQGTLQAGHVVAQLGQPSNKCRQNSIFHSHFSVGAKCERCARLSESLVTVGRRSTYAAVRCPVVSASHGWSAFAATLGNEC
jgi:hypothetical protein